MRSISCPFVCSGKRNTPASGDTRQCSCSTLPGPVCSLVCTTVCRLPRGSARIPLAMRDADSRRTCAVDVTADYSPSLDEHVIARSRYCSGPDGVGVPRVPLDLDWMSVGMNQQENQYRIQKPSVDSRQVDNYKADEKRKRPDLADHSRESKLIPHFAKVCQDEHRDNCSPH